MIMIDAVRKIADEITEGRELNRTDRDVAERIWQILEDDGYIDDDGSPVWVRGNNYGNANNGIHAGWCYWNGDRWIEASISSPGPLMFLTDWMPPK